MRQLLSQMTYRITPNTGDNVSLLGYGCALSRHPRDKYYIAAKISNLEPETWSREETLKMYYNSFKELQVDYIDYMMLHGVGMDFLDSTAQKFVRYPLIPCNDCKYCMPCPYGIDIPGILSHFNKYINEDLMPVSSQDENYRELRRAFLIGYDRSVPKLRQDNHCVGCDQCIRKCPQRINIPKQMRRIDKFGKHPKNCCNCYRTNGKSYDYI